MAGIVAAAAENPETRREFLDGSTRSYALLRSVAVGLGVYQPGWRWSLHVRPQTGKPSENHVGYVVSGAIMIQDSVGFHVVTVWNQPRRVVRAAVHEREFVRLVVLPVIIPILAGHRVA